MGEAQSMQEIQELLTALESPQESTRLGAVEQLARLGVRDTRIIRALEHAATFDPSARVGESAYAALAELTREGPLASTAVPDSQTQSASRDEAWTAANPVALPIDRTEEREIPAVGYVAPAEDEAALAERLSSRPPVASFGFSAGDLELNRQGRLARNQVHRLLFEQALPPMALAALVGAGLIYFMFWDLPPPTANERLLMLAFGGLLMIAPALRLALISLDLASGKVSKLVGSAVAIAKSGYRGGRTYYLRIGGLELRTTSSTYQTLNMINDAKRQYKVYYLPRSKVVVSVE